MNSMVMKPIWQGIMWAHPTVGLQHEIGLNFTVFT
jgi:hypothetical protein